LSGTTLQAAIASEATALERELTEIDLLIAQAKTEAMRHDQRRTQAQGKLAAATTDGPREVSDLITQLANLTRRAALMEAQVDVLEGKRKALGRFQETLARYAEAPDDNGTSRPDDDVATAIPAAVSKVVLTAQEDLRRDIARAMHDGPAQSLTNIVLQAQIVERLVTKDPEGARGEVRLLKSMVQQTLEATKSFIFDVRPMVLDDLGLVPTLRRAARDRGRRHGVAIDFESGGADRRLAVDVESTLFRIIDEALTAYLALAPDTISLRLDWGEGVEATVAARRAGAELAGLSSEPDVPDDPDLPPALASMIEDRRGERRAKVEAARTAAIAALPASSWRDIQQRAATIGATVELLDDGGTVRVTVPPESGGAAAAG
jgi:two-component system sensor histidine kinase DegS